MTGRTVTNGYGLAHKQQRQQWADHIATYGAVQCVCQGHCIKHQGRCTTMITNDVAWDLGHNEDRSDWAGPECVTCNRTAGGITRKHQQTMTIRQW